MTNYQEGGGSFPEEGARRPGGYQEGGYQDTPGYQDAPGQQPGQGGSSVYQGPPGYQGAGTSEGSQLQGGQVPWQGSQGGAPGYPPQRGQGHGGFDGGWSGGPRGSRGGGLQIRSTFKTTEFWIYVVAVVAILIAAAVTDEGPDNQGFDAQQAWKYVTWLTIAYLISRGLTKFGGHEHDHDHDHDRGRSGRER